MAGYLVPKLMLRRSRGRIADKRMYQVPLWDLASEGAPDSGEDRHGVGAHDAHRGCRGQRRIAGDLMLVASSGYLVLAAVLGVSGAFKIRNPSALVGQIENYQIVPKPVAPYAAAALAVTEVVCVPLLLLPPARRAGLVLAACLIMAFLAAMSIALAHGRRIQCGCFGGGELDTVGPSSVLRTALLGLIAIVSLCSGSTATHPVELLVAALLLVLVFLLAETARLLAQRWFSEESA
jgi:uncharacterized membrane protein YphA (DoxX/SURF4 family)